MERDLSCRVRSYLLILFIDMGSGFIRMRLVEWGCDPGNCLIIDSVGEDIPLQII